MVQPHPQLPPPRVGVRHGQRVIGAVPVLLRGHEASVVMEQAPAASSHVDLVLDWPDGRTTELGARVRRVDGDGRIAHLDVVRVEGDWRPFLCYLGAQA